MPARLLPSIGLVAFAISSPQSEAGHESSISLEHNASAAPFRAGDQLQLDPVSSKKLDMKDVTVLQTNSWPWVLVRCDAGGKPCEVWINFEKIRSARRLPTNLPVIASPPAEAK